MSDTEAERQKYVKDTRIACRFGPKCYQKNPVHLQKYKHPPKKKTDKLSPPVKRRRTHSHQKDENEEETNKMDVVADSPINEDNSDNKQVNNESHNSKDEKDLSNTAESKNKKGEINKQSELEDNGNSSNGPSVNINLGRTPKDFNVKQFIKEKFLVEMPEDFYEFWNFCKSLNDEHPENALKDIDLTLVGSFDVLAGKFNDIPEKPAEAYLTHWRYYYDPPEFQTVLKGSDKTGFHIGYFRDSPDEMPVFLASNHCNRNGELIIVGDNIFAAVNNYLEQLKKVCDPFKKISLERIQKKLCQKAVELKMELKDRSQKIRDRDKKIVTRSFNKMGIVVPYNRKTQVGYRDLNISNKELSALLTKIKEALPEQQKKHLSELQHILTGVSIATDECDFGTGIELGLDILAYGVDCLNSTASRYLATSYRLLQREAFAKIAEAHLKNRKKGVSLSIL